MLFNKQTKNSQVLETIFDVKTYLIFCDSNRISSNCVQANVSYNKRGQSKTLMPQLHYCFVATTKTKDDCLLSFTTGTEKSALEELI